MQSYKQLSRLPVTQAKRILFRTPSHNMSFFPRSFISEPATATSFSPLFNFLNEFDDYHSNRNWHHHRGGMKTFNPKFDVKEDAHSYELHGELPGIEQQNVEIEFTDLQTITVKGRTEHSHTSGTPPASVASIKGTRTITEGTETPSHKATVEDEGIAKSPTPVDTPKTEGAEVVKVDESKGPDAKYWVSERSVGEFSRSFSFPVSVDQDNVRASMKNGILSIIVPKTKKPESRKIAIN